MNSKRTNADIIRGLECLLDPDPTGWRCQECAYKCDDPEVLRERIERDALVMLKHFEAKRSGK